MTPTELQKKISDRAKVNSWLDKIGEQDEECRNEVLQQCKDEPEARAYYLQRSEE